MTGTSPHDLYRRWITELWAGLPVADELVSETFVGHWPSHDVHGPEELAATIAETRSMFTEIDFVLEVGPLADGDLVAGRWTGTGTTPDGPMRFFGNDILRVENGRFVEYWTASSAGS